MNIYELGRKEGNKHTGIIVIAGCDNSDITALRWAGGEGGNRVYVDGFSFVESEGLAGARVMKTRATLGP